MLSRYLSSDEFTRRKGVFPGLTEITTERTERTLYIKNNRSYIAATRRFTSSAKLETKTMSC